MEMIKFILGSVFILLGLFVFGVATFGIFRFKYVLNRVHVAAKCDSLASILVCIGLMFFSDSLAGILKLILISVFIWITNPVASHLVCKIEMETNENIREECEIKEEML
ncbi:MAG: monovalent cation/H(+) antiporter subunit G [Clostridiales bacterium]|nr:monovalent cation/H(+) antiporter subunit G [Clostridiales bacterium]